MKQKVIPYLITLLFAVLMTVPASAQQSAVQCVANIQKRLDDLGQQTDFDFLKAREIMQDFDFGKVTDAVGSADKAVAFKRVFTSLSEFCDAAGNSLSAKGMKGYTKQSGLLINSADETKTEANIAKLKEAFTQGGNFKGADFDGVMAKLGDEAKFDFDGATGTFTSKASGAKYAKHPQGSYRAQAGGAGGEPDAITHIFRGHTSNALTNSLSTQKSIFADAKDVLDLIDEAIKIPASSRNAVGGSAFWVDLGKNIGTDSAGLTTTKIRIVLRGGTTDVIHTAFPH